MSPHESTKHFQHFDFHFLLNLNVKSQSVNEWKPNIALTCFLSTASSELPMLISLKCSFVAFWNYEA